MTDQPASATATDSGNLELHLGTLHEVIPNVQTVVDSLIDKAATAKQYAALGSLLAARDALANATALIHTAWEAHGFPELTGR